MNTELLAKIFFIVGSIIFILEILFTACVAFSYFKIRKHTVYSYKNASHLGILILMFFIFMYTILHRGTLSNSFDALRDFIINIDTSMDYFHEFGLPIWIIVFSFVFVSNIALIKHEGFRFSNLLGILLGIAIILGSSVILLGKNYAFTYIFVPLYMNGYRWTLWIYYFLMIFLTVMMAYIECLMLGLIYYGWKADHIKIKHNKDYCIILGCGMKEDGTPYPLLQGRIDKALEFAKIQKERNDKDIIFVTSGGQGEDEPISEAECMKNYLVEKGIDERFIRMENKSTNTYENFGFSKQIIDAENPDALVIFSTTNYHVFRSGVYAVSEGLTNIKGIGAETKWFYFPNAFIREMVALLNNRFKSHAAACLFIFILSILIASLKYWVKLY